MLVAMNELSLHKFAKMVGPDGTILYNSEKLPAGFVLGEAKIYCVPASEIADGLGTTKATNMVMLGALLELTHALPRETAAAVLKAKVRNAKLLEVDGHAIDAGMACLHKQLVSPADAHTHDGELAPCS